jgi:hypothetical protein
VLNRDRIELIHREIDGANTPDESAAFRSLVAENPEARALAAELRRVIQLLDGVGEREPSPHLKRAILEALPRPARAVPPQTMTRWFVSQLSLATERLEEAFMTRKTMLIGGTVVAIAIVIAARIAGFPRESGTAGTIGGVEPAARYHGRVMTQADVTLQNPEIQALFQNQDILRLVQSSVFRDAMHNQAFRELQASDAYRQLMASDVYRQIQAVPAYGQLMASEAYRQLQANEAFRQMQVQGAFREAQSAEAMRQLQANAAFREVMASDAYRQIMANDAFRQLMASDAFREVMANSAYRQLMANDAFRQLQANEAFFRLQASDAFRQLQAAETFRALSRSQELSDRFMREAMRVAQP